MTSSLTPYLAVTDATAAIAFYGDVLGATLVAEPFRMGDGRIGHAELRVAGALLMLSEEFPDLGHVAGPGGVSLRVEVPDAAAAVDAAVGRGGGAAPPVQQTAGGVGGTIRDPFGIRWMITEGR